MLDDLRLERRPTPVHANYWLSGVAGHQLKHELDLPLVSTFHTLARVKAETTTPSRERRSEAEAEVIGCSRRHPRLVRPPRRTSSAASTTRPAERIEIVPPGVDHAFFSPG